MYRIDTFRPGETKPASPPVYLSLATASPPPNGEGAAEDAAAITTGGGHLATVGRRATILIEKDKSVSRHHLHLHLLSNNAKHQQPLYYNKNGDEEKVVAQAAGIPQSKEEKDACAKNPLGMALVIKCQGKFGSAMIAFGKKEESNDNGNDGDTSAKQQCSDDDDDDTTDDAGSDTEDESQKPAKIDWASGDIPDIPQFKIFDNTKQIISQMMMKVSQHNNKNDKNKKNSGYTLLVPPQKINSNEQCVVPGNGTTIILQCGQMGSLMVINRLDLSICKSGWTKSQEKLWDAQLYSVGATLVRKDIETAMFQDHKNRQSQQPHALTPWVNKDDDGLPRTTYMIAPQREAVTKQLMAHNLGIPMASMEFLEALLLRPEPSVPWPKIDDHAPVSNDEMMEGFWTQTKSATMLESCTLLTTSEKAHKECEQLVQSAGGTVVPIFSMKDKEAQPVIQQLLDDPAKKDGLFAISSSRKKKIAVWIDKQGIPHVKLKELVAAMIQQKQLTGEDGQIIGRKEVVETAASSDKDEAVSSEKQPEADVEMKESTEGKEDESNIKPAKEKRGVGKSKRKPDDVVEDPGEKDPEEQRESKRPRSSKESSRGSSRAAQSQSEKDVDILPPVEEEHSKLNDTAASEENQNSMQADNDGDDGEEEQAQSMHNKKEEQKRIALEKSKSTTNKGVKQREMKGTGLKKLEKTKDGWLVCAPKRAALRQAYLKPRSQMLEDLPDDEAAPVIAETIVMSGLIYRPYDPNGNSIASVGAKSREGKDFKKFRKNPILKCKSRIELRSEIPKETQKQKELEEQQRQIDAQAELADELFNIGGNNRRIAKPARKRR